MRWDRIQLLILNFIALAFIVLMIKAASAAGILLLAKAPVVCVPGNSTGEMDFSKCSNVGITAAVF